MSAEVELKNGFYTEHGRFGYTLIFFSEKVKCTI